MAIIKQAISRFGNKPVTIRESLHEEYPSHADMLRYDTAFHSPQDVSIIWFPIFKTRHGKIGGQITFRRWESFSISVRDIDISQFESASIWNDWVTYQHKRGNHTLIKMTLKEFLADPDRKDWKLVR